MSGAGLANGVGLMLLVANSGDGAQEALKGLQRLNRDCWIEIIDYSLIDSGSGYRACIREENQIAGIAKSVVAESMTAIFMGDLFGPIDGAMGTAAGPVIQAAGLGESDNPLLFEITNEIRNCLRAGNSALGVVLEERYMRRATVELQKRGRTFHMQLSQSQWEAGQRLFLRRIRDRIETLETELRELTARLDEAGSDDKPAVTTALAAKQAQLDEERRTMGVRLRAICSALDASLCEMKKRVEGAEMTAKLGIERSIRKVERAIENCSEILALSMLDHVDSLHRRAEELEARTAKASRSAKAAMESQLHEIETRMKEGHAELVSALLTWALNEQQRIDGLRPLSTLGGSSLNHDVDARLKKLQDTHAQLRVDIHRLEKRSGRVHHELVHGLRTSYRALSQSIEKTRLEYHGQFLAGASHVA
jgi:hypothetical protein